MTSLTARISEFALSDDLPPAESLQMMRLSLLDWAACGIAGAGEPVSAILRDMVLAEAGRGEAVLFGGGLVPARAAALANGTISHALDYDDTHFAHIGHPSVAVIPAALAVAQREKASGAAFLDAALRGVEISVRVGEWLGRAHYQTGFHQTGTAGAFGACAAAGRVLRLNEAAMVHALGLVSTKAAGLKSQFGTMGKPYNAGQAAAAGVEAALLARAGFISNPDALDGPQGFGPTHHGEHGSTAIELCDAAWAIDTISHKFHACCHGTHAMIEALLSARDRVDLLTLENLTVHTHPRWLTVCNIAEPATGLETKFSYRLIAAMVLSGQDTGDLASFSDAAAQDTRLAALRDKIHVVTDEGLSEMQTRLVIQSEGGSETVAFDLDAPISLEDREAKLLRKAQALVGEEKITILSDAILRRDAPDLDALTAVISA